MFGFENQNKKPEKFEFDLETELKEGKQKTSDILTRCEDMSEHIKQELKKNHKNSGFKKEKKEIDNYGVLLHGYSALNRVIKRIDKKIKEKKNGNRW